jgi:hypothetical protein
MCPGDPLGNHGQRVIALALIFEPVVANEDGVGMSAPLTHQSRAGLQRDTGIEGGTAFFEISGQGAQTAPQGPARPAKDALLQIIGELVMRHRAADLGRPVPRREHAGLRSSSRPTSQALVIPHTAHLSCRQQSDPGASHIVRLG